MARTCSRLGALLVSVGLTCLGVAAAMPVAATPTAPIDVCRNQQGTSSDCTEPAPVGTVTTEVIDGGIVFRISGAEGTTWSRLALCIPGSTPSPENDCDTTSASVLDPSAGEYSVSGDGVASSTSVEFACTDSIVATVPRSTLDGVNNPIPWALELTNCAGGSDEAFGSVTRGSASGVEYRCADVSGLTATSAVLHATTTDEAVTAVEFTLTKGGTTSVTDTDGSDGWSASLTGLTANTSYAYQARFFNESGTKVASEGGCLFATPASSATSTSTTSTSTTSTSTTSTSTTSTSTTSTSTTSTSTTSTTEAPTTTTPSIGGTSSTPVDDIAVLPATLQRIPGTPTDVAPGAVAAAEITPGAVAGAAAASPQALARTGFDGRLTTLGVTLIVAGSLAVLVGRARREDDDLVPVPLAHPTVPLEPGGSASGPATRRVVIRER